MVLEQYKNIHTLLNILYLQPLHPTVRQVSWSLINDALKFELFYRDRALSARTR